MKFPDIYNRKKKTKVLNYLLGGTIMSAIAKIDYHENNECCLRLRKHNTNIRQNKVLDIRNKLNSGRYNIKKRLNIAVDRLIEDILLP